MELQKPKFLKKLRQLVTTCAKHREKCDEFRIRERTIKFEISMLRLILRWREVFQLKYEGNDTFEKFVGELETKWKVVFP